MFCIGDDDESKVEGSVEYQKKKTQPENRKKIDDVTI